MQKKRHSLLEALLSTAIGFGIAFAANFTVLPWFGYKPTVVENLLITTIFTIISVVRGYAVRRLFNWLHVRGIL